MAEQEKAVSPPPTTLRPDCGFNPAVILFGMVIASTFNWFFGSKGKARQATRFPRYTLGDEVDGREVTAIRTTWEYQFNDGTQWTEEGG